MKLEISKRGFLLGEFSLKMVIAVIAILFLTFLLFSLYNIFSDNEQLKEAEATLNQILSNVESVSGKEFGEKGSVQSFPILEPKDWYLLYYSDGKPKSCENQKCLCICKPESNFPWGNNQLEQCNEKGICRKVRGDIIFIGNQIVISNTQLEVSKGKLGIAIESK